MLQKMKIRRQQNTLKSYNMKAAPLMSQEVEINTRNGLASRGEYRWNIQPSHLRFHQTSYPQELGVHTGIVPACQTTAPGVTDNSDLRAPISHKLLHGFRGRNLGTWGNVNSLLCQLSLSCLLLLLIKLPLLPIVPLPGRLTLGVSITLSGFGWFYHCFPLTSLLR